MKTISLSLAAILCLSAGASVAGAPGPHSVSLTHDPLVMRVSNDEFRIAFGLNGQGCATGCNGMVSYRVEWKGAGGEIRSETRRVAYVVSPVASHTIAVDRQYFHAAEGRGTTEIVKVTVEGISCVAGTEVAAGELAKL